MTVTNILPSASTLAHMAKMAKSDRRAASFPDPGAETRNRFLPKERSLVRQYRTPKQVQDFLRRLPYNWEQNGETLRTFRGVVQHGSAHCLEAALTAATILEQHGYPPLLMDFESQDKLDHVVFLFRQRGRWGTVARSRDFGLHGRKPVFRTLRSLAMSYVDPYVDNTARVKGYGVLDLRTLPRCDWRLSRQNVWAVERRLIEMPHWKLSTSDRRHKLMLRRYRTFRRKHPQGPVTFYEGQDRWL